MQASHQLGKYRLIIELAQGGMGCVYLAFAQGLAGFSKLAVVKELKPSLAEEHGFLEMFLDEARLCARLNHPNVVQTNDVAI
ncbi:MAG TPA: serine/threonine protein kinase, partial [Labilithrix sp.]